MLVLMLMSMLMSHASVDLFVLSFVLPCAYAYVASENQALETAIRLMTPGCFMTSIDLKDAYYSVPMALEHQKYLKFVWRNQLYAFTCLPMGLTSSPRIFTKILKPVFATLRAKFGHSCLGYTDDSLNLADSYAETERATLHAVELLISLGFMIRRLLNFWVLF